jgi:hypothetical protein
MAKRVLLAHASPVLPKSFLLPGYNGIRLDERQGLLLVCREPEQPCPEHAVGGAESWAMDHLLRDHQLLPQREMLQAQRLACSEPHGNEGQEGRGDERHRQRSPHTEEIDVV